LACRKNFADEVADGKVLVDGEIRAAESRAARNFAIEAA
jgi:hypothetical protein